jgi:TolB-like protein/Flp pilus assembly protein TadD
MPEPSLRERLKERKLVQWALAYLAGAFFVYTGLDPARETWGIPETVIRGVHILLIAGFFITLVLAWYHGEKGRQRVSGPELLMVAALLVVAGAALTWVRGPSEDSSARPRPSVGDEPRIAVLPCANRSPNPEDANFADGLHEEIISRLQGISSLLAIGRTSVLGFADPPPPVPEIAGILPADFIGECSVLKDLDQNRIRITFRLLNAGGIQVWNRSYDRDLNLDNIFAVLSEIPQRVADQVGAFLTPAEQVRNAARPTESQEAWDAYLLARYLNARPGTESARRAISLGKEAIQLDPEFSPAYVELAQAYRNLAWYTSTIDPAPIADSIQWALENAIRSDSRNAVAYASLADFLLHWRWDLNGARAAIQRSLSLEPNLPAVRHANALFSYYSGDLDRALAEMRRASEEDPLGVVTTGDLGIILERMGRLDEAKAQYERALQIDPDNTIIGANLAWIYLLKNMPDSALSAYERLDLEDDPDAAPGLVQAYIQLDDRDSALHVYDKLRSFAAQNRVSTAFLALAVLPLDEDQAFELLGQAVEEHDPHLLDTLISFYWEPSWRLEILHRMGLDLEGETLVALEGES